VLVECRRVSRVERVHAVFFRDFTGIGWAANGVQWHGVYQYQGRARARKPLGVTYNISGKPPLHNETGAAKRDTDLMRTAVLAFMGFALMAETVGGLRWTPPAGWKSEGTAPMRAATYKIPPSSGDPVGAECVVYFFGAGQGGSVQANIERWNGQFTGSDGKPATAHIQKRTVHGLPVTTIDVTGQYSGMGGPMATTKAVKAGYRLLGAIIENPGGNVFLKFTGPEKVIAANQRRFDQMLESFVKE